MGECGALIVRVAVAEPPADSTTHVGLNARLGVLRPRGVIVAPRQAVPENPFRLVKVIVHVTIVPRSMEMLVEHGVTEKS